MTHPHGRLWGYYQSEGKIIGTLAEHVCGRSSGLLGNRSICGLRCGCCCGACDRCCCGLSGREGGSEGAVCVGSLDCSGIVRSYTPSAYAVEPTTVILVCVDVKINGEELANLNVELLNFVCAEHLEVTLLGVLLKGFYYIRAATPLGSAALAHAAAFRQDVSDFSGYLHKLIWG